MALVWWLLGGTFPIEGLWVVLVIFGFAIAGLMVVCNAQRRDGVGGPSALGWVLGVAGMLCWVAAPVPTWLAGWPFFAGGATVLSVLGLVILALMGWAFIAQRRRIVRSRLSNGPSSKAAWIAVSHEPRLQPTPGRLINSRWRLVGVSIAMTVSGVLLGYLLVDSNVGPGKYPGVMLVMAPAVASWAILVGERRPIPGPRPLGWVFIVIGWVFFAQGIVWLLLGADSKDIQRAAIVLLVEALAIAALALWGWTRQRAWITWYFGPRQGSGPSGQVDANRSRRI